MKYYKIMLNYKIMWYFKKYVKLQKLCGSIKNYVELKKLLQL